MLSSSICALVMGNIDGLADTPDQGWYRGKSEQLSEGVATAVARAQAKKAKKPIEGFELSSQFETLYIDSVQRA